MAIPSVREIALTALTNRARRMLDDCGAVPTREQINRWADTIVAVTGPGPYFQGELINRMIAAVGWHEATFATKTHRAGVH